MGSFINNLLNGAARLGQQIENATTSTVDRANQAFQEAGSEIQSGLNQAAHAVCDVYDNTHAMIVESTEQANEAFNRTITLPAERMSEQASLQTTSALIFVLDAHIHVLDASREMMTQARTLLEGRIDPMS